MNEQSRFRVLVAVPMDSAAGRKKLNGIHRFLSEGYDWDMELIRSGSALTADLIESVPAGGFDGLLVCCVEDERMREAHCRTRLPTVLTDNPDPRVLQANPFSVFLNDDPASIAQKAVQHLTAYGKYRCFGYVPTRTPFRWSEERQAAFAARLDRLHISLKTYTGDGHDRERLEAWLAGLPRPVAILAAFDDRAHDVLEACLRLGLQVPEDVAVLGIGNDEPICEACKPPLSSVAVDFEEEGRLSARELHAMMLRARKPSRRVILCGARDVVIRSSTRGMCATGAIAARALAFIEKNALRGITPRDVVRHLRVSRSLTDLRFKEATGTTLQETILLRRLDAVKALLKKTDLGIAEVARRCGYRDANYLKNLFKRKNGVSMRDWRK